MINQIYMNLFGRESASTSLPFWVGSLHTTTDTISGIMGDSTPDVGPLQLTVENTTSTVTVSTNTELSADTSSILPTVIVQSGVSLQYLSHIPIDTLVIGNNDTVNHTLVGSTSFSGLVDIGQTIVNDNVGEVNLNVQGTIGSLQIPGGNPQLVLSPSTTIINLIVPPGINPRTIFLNSADLSSVKAINGLSTASTP